MTCYPIDQWIVTWLSSRSSLEEIDPEKDYYLTGLLDSLGVFELVCACEEQFGFQFSDDDLKSDQLRTVTGLVKIIKKRALIDQSN